MSEFFTLVSDYIQKQAIALSADEAQRLENVRQQSEVNFKQVYDLLLSIKTKDSNSSLDTGFVDYLKGLLDASRLSNPDDYQSYVGWINGYEQEEGIPHVFNQLMDVPQSDKVLHLVRSLPVNCWGGELIIIRLVSRAIFLSNEMERQVSELVQEQVQGRFAHICQLFQQFSEELVFEDGRTLSLLEAFIEGESRIIEEGKETSLENLIETSYPLDSLKPILVEILKRYDKTALIKVYESLQKKLEALTESEGPYGAQTCALGNNIDAFKRYLSDKAVVEYRQARDRKNEQLKTMFLLSDPQAALQKPASEKSSLEISKVTSSDTSESDNTKKVPSALETDLFGSILYERNLFSLVFEQAGLNQQQAFTDNLTELGDEDVSLYLSGMMTPNPPGGSEAPTPTPILLFGFAPETTTETRKAPKDKADEKGKGTSVVPEAEPEPEVEVEPETLEEIPTRKLSLSLSTNSLNKRQ